MNDKQLEQFDLVVATFQPARTDDLVEGAAEWIGRRMTWEALWIIESGQFEGQWAMMCIDEGPRPPFAWAAFSDLADIAERYANWIGADNGRPDFSAGHKESR